MEDQERDRENKQREKDEKELERLNRLDKERERIENEYEEKRKRDQEKREGRLKAKEELDREKEERERMKYLSKEERDRQRQKEKEEKDKQREREREERNRREEKNRKARLDKERQKQLEKEEKLREKEEKERQKQKERELRELEKRREKEEKEREKQRLKEERRRYNERFKNEPINKGKNRIKSSYTTNSGKFYQRFAYNSNRLYHRRRHSHKRIQPKNRIPALEPKRNLGKTTLKIMKPKRYDDDESETEPGDFEHKLMKFPKFKAKYGKNYLLKEKTITFENYMNEMEEIERNKMRLTKKTNITISGNEEEEKNNRKNILRKGQLSQVKPRGRGAGMDKKMREILGKHYKVLLDDPLNPYSTCWPSNFLKVGYEAGFEYNDFQSGVPVLKLRSLGKKHLPPIKKKGTHFNNETNFTPNKVSVSQHFYPGNSDKKNFNEVGYDIKVNKSEILNHNSTKKEEEVKLDGIIEENENL